MSDDPASKDGLRWEIRRSLTDRLRIRWDAMGEMANQQREEAAVQISTMMDEIEAWRQSSQKADRHIAELRGMLDIANEMAEHYARERDEARRSVCEMSIQLGGVFRRVGGKVVEVTTAEGCAEIMRWDCYKEKP